MGSNDAMSAITTEIVTILQAEVSSLTDDIASYLFNEPLEQDSVTDLFNKLRGTCRLLEMESAVILVDELKKTVNSVVDKGGKPASYQPELTSILEAFPPLFRACQQVNVRSPFLFMPELAILRRIQGVPPLYEFQLVKNHEWPPGSRFRGETALDEDARANLKKLKQVYQMGLLEILRGRDREKGADMLAKVCGKLRLIFTSPEEDRYWQLVERVTLGFRDGLLGFNTVRMRLLAAVERQLKTLLDGDAEVTKAYPLGLWRAYGILLSLMPEKDEPARELCEWVGAPDFDFSDDDINQARAMIFGDEDTGLETLIDDIASRLNSLHNVLELVDSQGQLSGEESDEFAGLVKEVADLCEENGLSQAASRFRDHHDYIRAASGESWEPGSELLKETAHSILYLECLMLHLREQGVALRGLLDKLDLRGVDEVVEEKLVDTSVHAAWLECLRKLAAAKDILDDVANDLAGSEVSEDLLAEMDEIRGAATLVGDEQVEDIVERCCRFIKDRLFVVEGEEKTALLASFADAVVALEYYFENTARGEKSEFVLTIADDYLAALEAA